MTFYFVAEKRIDFRELVRELFRYELTQKKWFLIDGFVVIKLGCIKRGYGWLPFKEVVNSMSNEVSMGLIFLFFLSFFLFAPTHSGPPASPIYFLPFLPHNSIRSMITLQDIHFSLYHQTNRPTKPLPHAHLRDHRFEIIQGLPSLPNTHADLSNQLCINFFFFLQGRLILQLTRLW